jgi:hypothetical protein
MIILLMAGLLVASASCVFAGGESEVYYWDDAAGGWVHNPVDQDLQLARLFRTGDFYMDSCNKAYWEIPVHIKASIAQWVKFKLDWNTWEWFVRKPGCYAGNSIEATLWSNGDVEVGYLDFNKLMPVDPDNADHNPVDIWYGFESGEFGGGVQEVEYRGWTHADDMYMNTSLIEDVAGPNNEWPLHYGIAWKLWSKICVIQCNSACDYYDDAKITITLKEQKDWIVWETGQWGF